jgi:predicted MFS family arabinose efflux permease
VNGWRIAWFVFGAVTMIIAGAGFFLLRNRPAEMGIRPLCSNNDSPSASPRGDGLHWGSVYRSVTVWHLGLVYIAFGFSYIIYMTFFIKLLVTEGGYTQPAAGNLFMVMGWFSLFCGLIWGGISDLIGRKNTLIIVYLIQATAFSLFALWTVPIGFTLSAILFGLTAWSIPAIMAATCGDVLGPRMAPAALGFITLFFGTGQAIGPSIAGIIADATGSFFSAFLTAGVVALLGALGSSMLHPHPPA